MEDTQIIEMLFARKEQAINDLEVLYGRRLSRLAEAILHNKEDADECVNDTLWKTWNAIPPARPAHLYLFVAKICRNTALTRLEYKNAGKRQGILLELTSELEQCIPDKMAQAKEQNLELSACLNSFLGTITREKRMVFIRRYWYGDSITGIAERYLLSETKVRTMLFRTRHMLRKYLEKEGYTI